MIFPMAPPCQDVQAGKSQGTRGVANIATDRTCQCAQTAPGQVFKGLPWCTAASMSFSLVAAINR
jgi:hypothetical protein